MSATIKVFYVGDRCFRHVMSSYHDQVELRDEDDETLLTYQHVHVAVETQGEYTRGMTVCDLRTLTEEGRALRLGLPPNAHVAIASDAPRLIAGVVDALLAYP